jgi:hypothetical protein
MPGLRWDWCDEVEDSPIAHTGWFSDEDGAGDKIRGLVMRLPQGRGFIAGWSMGKRMASEVETDSVYDTAREAALAADGIAERVAEKERDYQAAWQAGQQWADLGEEIATTRQEVIALCREARAARRAAIGDGFSAICTTIRQHVRAAVRSIGRKREKRAEIVGGYWDAGAFNDAAGEAVL